MDLGKRITEQISIPTIGIGAGKYCDGQILVFHDLVGLSDSYQPKFARKYADTYGVIHNALERYINDVQEGNFPNEAESLQLNRPEK